MHCGFVLAASLGLYKYRIDFIKVVSPTFFRKAATIFLMQRYSILEKGKEYYFMKFAPVSSVTPSKQFQTPRPLPHMTARRGNSQKK